MVWSRHGVNQPMAQGLRRFAHGVLVKYGIWILVGLLATGAGLAAWWLPKRTISLTTLRASVSGWVHPVPESAVPVAPPPDYSATVAALQTNVRDLQAKVDGQGASLSEVQGVTDGIGEQLKAVSERLTAIAASLTKQSQELDLALRKQSSTEGGTPDSPSSSKSPTVSGKVNLNTATAAQLDSLPGVGPTYAQRIVEYRTQHGAFKSVDDLLNVSGIGEATLAKFKNQVEV